MGKHRDKRVKYKYIILALSCLSLIFIIFQDRKRTAIEYNREKLLDLINNRYQNDSGRKFRKVNILALGGSVTWGSTLLNRTDAFPFLLGNLHPGSIVDNLAVRATGANYPASCIQSMVEGGGAADVVYEEDKEEIFSTVPTIYDIILLEFSVNGFPGTEFLMNRLRNRYPDAIIIYVHLHSLTHPPRESLSEEFFVNTMKPVNGIYYMFPVEVLSDAYGRGNEHYSDELLGLYANDRHHLSKTGHEFLADQLTLLLQNTLLEPADALTLEFGTLGEWDAGDQCYLWFMNDGKLPESLDVEGGTFTSFNEMKYSYEVKQGETTTFSFQRKEFNGKMFGKIIPFHLVYMTLGNPPKYPKTLITLNPHDEQITSTHLINPTDDPMFPEWSWAHLTRPEVVGSSRPGKNTFTIQPQESTENPFRLVGIIICAVCFESQHGQRMKSVSNMRMRIPTKEKP